MKQQTVGHEFNNWKNFQNFARLAAALFVIEVLARMFLGDKVFIYERLSGVRNESTIVAQGGKKLREKGAENKNRKKRNNKRVRKEDNVINK